MAMNEDFGWNKWALTASSTAEGPKGPINLRTGASDKEVAAMNDAYETISKIVKESRASAKSMAAMIAEDSSKDPVGTIAELIQKAQKTTRTVQTTLDELDDMSCAPRMTPSDVNIKKVLTDVAPIVANLIHITTDLKSLLQFCIDNFIKSVINLFIV